MLQSLLYVRKRVLKDRKIIFKLIRVREPERTSRMAETLLLKSFLKIKMLTST